MAELELLDRERRATERRIRQAKFPVTKSLKSFDFLAMPTLNKAIHIISDHGNEYTLQLQEISGETDTHLIPKYSWFPVTKPPRIG